MTYLGHACSGNTETHGFPYSVSIAHVSGSFPLTPFLSILEHKKLDKMSIYNVSYSNCTCIKITNQLSADRIWPEIFVLFLATWTKLHLLTDQRDSRLVSTGTGMISTSLNYIFFVYVSFEKANGKKEMNEAHTTHQRNITQPPKHALWNCSQMFWNLWQHKCSCNSFLAELSRKKVLTTEM